MARNGSSRNSGARVPAVERAVRVLEVFRDGDEALGVSELSRRLEVNKSTLHGILNTLSYHHLLERDERTKTYRLGYGLFALGRRVETRLDLRALAHPYIVRLARAAEETVLLGVYRDEHIFILDREEAPHDLRISARVGQRMPFSSGVFGQIFGAALSDEELERVTRLHRLRAFTPNSITRLPAYRERLKQVRARGYAVECGEFLEGVSAAAAPIVNAQGQVSAALCVVGLSARLPAARLDRLGVEAQRTAGVISRRLGAANYPAWNGTGQ